VRVPTNYRATAAHPLIVVYAPRGGNRFLLERFVGLTREATAAGFVIAYADARDLSLEVVRDLATIPSLVAGRWCIDPDRVSLTGHSDGGTVASAIAFRPETRGLAAAIAPSAAGVRATDLLAETCPPPLSVLVLHGREDSLFPGYGTEAARWWATCNGCDVDAARRRDDGCVDHPACDGGVETVLCEHEGGHLDWPARSPTMLEFFARSRRGRSAGSEGGRAALERDPKEAAGTVLRTPEALASGNRSGAS
jgi:polyhydroxybutyrate depolymerase